MTTFDYAFEKTLSREDGYSGDPADRSGKTNFGITAEVLKDAYLRGIYREYIYSHL